MKIRYAFLALLLLGNFGFAQQTSFDRFDASFTGSSKGTVLLYKGDLLVTTTNGIVYTVDTKNSQARLQIADGQVFEWRTSVNLDHDLLARISQDGPVMLGSQDQGGNIIMSACSSEAQAVALAANLASTACGSDPDGATCANAIAAFQSASDAHLNCLRHHVQQR